MNHKSGFLLDLDDQTTASLSDTCLAAYAASQGNIDDAMAILEGLGEKEGAILGRLGEFLAQRLEKKAEAAASAH